MWEPFLLLNDIEKLAAHESICPREPWTSGAAAVEKYYRELCDNISRRCRVLERGDWDHYGSGYASFVHAWFYGDEKDFRVPLADQNEHAFVGLSVVLCRLADLYVLQEHAKGWGANGGYGALPSFEGIDEFRTPEVASLAVEVEAVLKDFGMKRLSREELSGFLPEAISIETNLSSGPLREFDALFHWMD